MRTLYKWPAGTACSNCSDVAPQIIVGRCRKCWSYHYRHGVERPFGATTSELKAASKVGERNPNWKGDGITKAETGRERARYRYELGPCESCGEPGTDRHHKDGKTTHNEPENISILCRRCHMRLDGRMAALAAFNYNRRGRRGSA